MHVELRKWTQQDQTGLMEICNAVDRTYLTNRLPQPYTEEDASWWLHMVEENDGVHGIYRAVLVDGRLVGTISVEQKSDIFAKDAEIGYFLLTEHWSNGVMTEAVRRICDLAFCELNIVRITGMIHQPNTASQRVLEKNGFIREGVMKKAAVKCGDICDLCIYGKLKD